MIFDLKLLQLIFNADVRSRLRRNERGPTNRISLAGSNLALPGKGEGMVSVHVRALLIAGAEPPSPTEKLC